MCTLSTVLNLYLPFFPLAFASETSEFWQMTVVHMASLASIAA